MTPSSVHQIIIDDREQAGAVVARLREDPTVRLTIARLAVGDYQIDDLLRARDADETAWLLTRAAHQARAVAAGALPRHSHRPRGKARLQSHLLQGLPGIGPTRARRLIERFGSVEAVVAASAADLAAVPGIGEATAKAIRWAVGEAAAGYREVPAAVARDGDRSVAAPAAVDIWPW